MELYSEKMELLIKAALADGELTDKERQVLMRKAAEEGIDPDEFEMVLNARLFEIQKARQESSSVPEKKVKVRTCPNCGATIGDNYLTCPECGFAFINESSASESVHHYLSEFEKELKSTRGSLFVVGNKRVDKIMSLKVPNTKEALIQATLFCIAHRQAVGSIYEQMAWKSKARELYHMIKAQPQIDKATQQFIDQYAYIEKKSFMEAYMSLFKI